MHDRELDPTPAVPRRRRREPATEAQHVVATAFAATQAGDHTSLLRRLPSTAWHARQHAVTDLQRSFGNRYTQRVIARAVATDAGPGLETPGAESALDTSIASARGGGQPLDPSTRARMEDVFGVDLSQVRAHTGPRAASLSRDLGARAFTTGRDIFFGHGQYDPASTEGRELLAHELTHVVQQGRSMLSASGVSHPHDASEREAAAIGRSVAHGSLGRAPLVTQRATAAVQRMSWSELNGLKKEDYTHAVYNTTTKTGFYLFTIWHKTEKYRDIQVHWHPGGSAAYPHENWTVRWANEGSGNKPAADWMKDMVRETPKALAVGMASMGGSGEEYRAQWPSLTST